MLGNVTFNYLAIARSLKILDICGIVLCDKTPHFRMAFYCSEHKMHMCTDHAGQHLDMPHLSGG
jgi:hypothetical protein